MNSEASSVRVASEFGEFKPGARVQYKYGYRMTGILVRRIKHYHANAGSWLVLWENGREMQAFEVNMDLLP